MLVVEVPLKDRYSKLVELLEGDGTRLHAVLARLTRCEDAVGDLMQELVVRLCRSRGFEKARDPFGYACRAATNLAFEWRRKRRIGTRLLDQDCRATDRVGSPLGVAIEEEQLQRVLDATAQLNDLARDAVVMRYIEQESYEEIARRLGKKPQHIRSVTSKALARLRALLANDGNGEMNRS